MALPRRRRVRLPRARSRRSSSRTASARTSSRTSGCCTGSDRPDASVTRTGRRARRLGCRMRRRAAGTVRPTRARPPSRSSALMRPHGLARLARLVRRERDHPASTTTRPSRSSERTASSSRPASSRGASATSRSVVARRCRNEPSNGPCFRAARRGSRATGSCRASGHSPQRGTRARQTVAPRSISACAALDENSCAGSLLDATRRSRRPGGRRRRTRSNAPRPPCTARRRAAP